MNKEYQRLETIKEFKLKAGGDEPGLNGMLEIAAQFFNVPIALVTVLDEKEQFFKARYGITLQRTRREDALCNLLVEQDTPLIIEDTLVAPEFASHPLVTGEPYIRFYAGVPLRLQQVTVGAVCLMDTEPRQLDKAALLLLEKLSTHVTSYLTLQLEQSRFNEERSLLNDSPAVIVKWNYASNFELSFVSANVEDIFGLSVPALSGLDALLEDYILPDDLPALNFALNNHINGVEVCECHYRLLSPQGAVYWVKQLSKGFFAPTGNLQSIHAMLLDYTENRYVEEKLNETNQQMRLLLEASALGTWDWNILADVNKVNMRWCEILGIEYDQFDTSSNAWRRLLHPADAKRVSAELQQHLQGTTKIFNTEYRMQHQAGHWIWIETYGRVVEHTPDGRPKRLAGTHRDITYKKEAELLERKQRQLLGFINKAQTIYLRDNNLSQACKEILPELLDIADSQFGFIGQMRIKQSQSCLFIQAISDVVWNYDSNQAYQQYQAGELYFRQLDNLFGHVITAKKVVLTNKPASHPAAKGTPAGHPKILRFLGLPIFIREQVVGMIGLANKLSDYTEEDARFLQPLLDTLGGLFFAVETDNARMVAEEQLKNLAMSDPLTGIPNRRAFLEHCRFVYSEQQKCTLVIIDIDYFKAVNDTYGHQAGDVVIKDIARLIKSSVRSDDYVARLGGEEFAIVMLGDDQSLLHTLLETLRNNVEQEIFRFHEHNIRVTVSLGASRASANSTGLAGISCLEKDLEAADQALYCAKQQGRNRVCWAADCEAEK